MKLTKDQVKHVAKLANLPLTDKEEEIYSEQLSKILDYIDQLDEVDTVGIDPTYNVSGNTNVTQEDLVNKSLTQEQALENASQKKEGFFVTRGVFEHD